MPILSPEELKGMKKPELLAYAMNLGDEHSQLQNEVADRLTRIEHELRSSNDQNSRLTEEVANLSTEVATLNTRLSVTERSLVAAERSSNSNAQYARNRQLELWNLPSKITDAKDLKCEAAKIVSLTGVDIKAEDIDVSHKIKKTGVDNNGVPQQNETQPSGHGKERVEKPHDS
jgi:predicted nuclease with TOPRIM domain